MPSPIRRIPLRLVRPRQPTCPPRGPDGIRAAGRRAASRHHPESLSLQPVSRRISTRLSMARTPVRPALQATRNPAAGSPVPRSSAGSGHAARRRMHRGPVHKRPICQLSVGQHQVLSVGQHQVRQLLITQRSTIPYLAIQLPPTDLPCLFRMLGRFRAPSMLPKPAVFPALPLPLLAVPRVARCVLVLRVAVPWFPVRGVRWVRVRWVRVRRRLPGALLMSPRCRRPANPLAGSAKVSAAVPHRHACDGRPRRRPRACKPVVLSRKARSRAAHNSRLSVSNRGR